MEKTTITQEMRMLASLIAHMRTIVNRHNNVQDQKMGDQDFNKTDYLGALGELAFAKHFNVYPDLSLHPRTGQADATLMGHTFDVKTTKVQDGRLMAKHKTNFEGIERYALVIINKNEDEALFPGHAAKEELINTKRLQDFGHGLTYAMDQHELTKWKKRDTTAKN